METNNINSAVEKLAALAQTSRLEVFRFLVQHAPVPQNAGTLATALALPKATLSFHLKTLTHSGLIQAAPAGREIRYSPRFDQMDALVAYLLENCCNGQSCAAIDNEVQIPAMTTPSNAPKFNVLVLCTGNSARSIMAEAALADNRIGQGKFNAYSAGSQPTGKPNPGALRLLNRHGLELEARSKSWDEFSGANAPKMDFIITVCGNAANEVCPIWPGQPTTAHWGVVDPADVAGSEAEIDAAFEAAYAILKRRIAAFAELPLHEMTAAECQQAAQRIGEEVQ